MQFKTTEATLMLHHEYKHDPNKVTNKRFSETAKPMTKAYSTDLGYDLYADEDSCLRFGVPTKIKTSIATKFPMGYGGFIKDRSSMASKGFVTVGGVIDPEYIGEISIIMLNLNFSFKDVLFGRKIKKGDKIAQIVPIETKTWDVVVVENLDEENSQRGSKGFGSSGK